MCIGKVGLCDPDQKKKNWNHPCLFCCTLNLWGEFTSVLDSPFNMCPYSNFAPFPVTALSQGATSSLQTCSALLAGVLFLLLPPSSFHRTLLSCSPHMIGNRVTTFPNRTVRRHRPMSHKLPFHWLTWSHTPPATSVSSSFHKEACAIWTEAKLYHLLHKDPE